MARVKLTIATTDYDHFRDFRLGLLGEAALRRRWAAVP
jgi:hypothetical protein